MPTERRHLVDAIQELRAYLEETGLPVHGEWFGGRDATVTADWERFIAAGKTPEEFYRESEVLMYHLVWFGEDMWKDPYRRLIAERYPPPRRLLEYGCGVGSDGIKLADRGYEVSFADFETRCTEFLKWRLEKRDWDNPIYMLGEDDIPRHDLVYAFDVLEHTPTPKVILEELAGLGDVVAVNFLTNLPWSDNRGYKLHYWMDVPELIQWLSENYNILHVDEMDNVTFVMYEGG